jgi:2-polyprenyl-3-methyl-5-hydroxy-6-metoxy-1,4-benzoquinol methylase
LKEDEMDKKTIEEDKWQQVKNEIHSKIGDERITLGPYFSYWIRHTPRRLLFALSYYKFAAKMLGEKKRVLEVGCSEGLGSVLLAEFNTKVIGLDSDLNAIKEAQQTFSSDKLEFIHGDFLTADIGQFDAIVSFDVIEHIFPENEELFFKSVRKHINGKGMCIIGTPNETSNVYASAVTRKGHINLYSHERLKMVMEKYFEQVFLFSANDEMVHTGFAPMAHYLIAVGISKKEGI